MDRGIFFNEVRDHVFGGALTQGQTQGCTAILDAWDKHAPKSDPRFIAESLATAFHETARTMQPIREFGKGAGRSYGQPTGPFKQAYYGRGLVQLTWQRNYALATAKLRARGILDYSMASDLERNPDLAMRPDIAACILVFGMLEGWFSGRKLADYFAGTRSDWIDARAIINGHDKAALIAGYGLHFYHALTTAQGKPA